MARRVRISVRMGFEARTVSLRLSDIQPLKHISDEVDPSDRTTLTLYRMFYHLLKTRFAVSQMGSHIVGSRGIARSHSHWGKVATPKIAQQANGASKANAIEIGLLKHSR
jgi:hypothetical protein